MVNEKPIFATCTNNNRKNSFDFEILDFLMGTRTTGGGALHTRTKLCGWQKPPSTMSNEWSDLALNANQTTLALLNATLVAVEPQFEPSPMSTPVNPELVYSALGLSIFCLS